MPVLHALLAPCRRTAAASTRRRALCAAVQVHGPAHRAVRVQARGWRCGVHPGAAVRRLAFDCCRGGDAAPAAPSLPCGASSLPFAASFLCHVVAPAPFCYVRVSVSCRLWFAVVATRKHWGATIRSPRAIVSTLHALHELQGTRAPRGANRAGVQARQHLHTCLTSTAAKGQGGGMCVCVGGGGGVVGCCRTLPSPAPTVTWQAGPWSLGRRYLGQRQGWWRHPLLPDGGRRRPAGLCGVTGHGLNVTVHRPSPAGWARDGPGES
jgi:hypothetical protein